MRRRASSQPRYPTDRSSTISTASTAINTLTSGSFASIAAGRLTSRSTTSTSHDHERWEKLKEVIIPDIGSEGRGRTIKIDISVLLDRTISNTSTGGDGHGGGMRWRSITWNNDSNDISEHNPETEDSNPDYDTDSDAKQPFSVSNGFWINVKEVIGTLSTIWLILVTVVVVVGGAMVCADLLGRGLEVVVPFGSLERV